jgi:proteasome lid subunit RPN8/RPN11
MSSSNLSLSSEQMEEMKRHIEDCYPEEGCGILGGFTDRVVWVFPITNMLHSTTRFQMDPREQIDAFFKIEDAGGKLIGIFHSHPNGPEFPSESDVRENAFPEAVHVIWHHIDEEWNYQAYRIDPVGGVVEVGIILHRP